MVLVLFGSKHLYIFYLTERICKNCVDVVVCKNLSKEMMLHLFVSCAKLMNSLLLGRKEVLGYAHKIE